MSRSATRNDVIDGLPSDSRGRLLEIAERVSLAHREILFDAESEIEWIYFPVSGAISLLTVMEGGETIEAGLVGREGAVGGGVILGRRTMPWVCIVQVPGMALRVQADSLLANPDLLQALLVPTAGVQAALHWQATLGIACNRFHSVEQRCSRWLLMVADRQDEDTLAITHQLLSEMLGVRRQSITESLRNLARLGLVRRAGQGHIRIVDHAGLQERSCECYRRMNCAQPLPSSA
ncbi:MAG: Crp/Fnr family transcriptional regulator [Dehalococcoidia bacterium]